VGGFARSLNKALSEGTIKVPSLRIHSLCVGACASQASSAPHSETERLYRNLLAQDDADDAHPCGADREVAV
jgi:hypothetical protein